MKVREKKAFSSYKSTLVGDQSSKEISRGNDHSKVPETVRNDASNQIGDKNPKNFFSFSKQYQKQSRDPSEETKA
jgi:hypothetical protein